MNKMIVLLVAVASINVYGMQDSDKNLTGVPAVAAQLPAPIATDLAPQPAAAPAAKASVRTWAQEGLRAAGFVVGGVVAGEVIYRTGLTKMTEQQAIRNCVIAATAVYGSNSAAQAVRARKAAKPVAAKPVETVVAPQAEPAVGVAGTVAAVLGNGALS